MPITLAEARKNVGDDIQAQVIDEFRKSSYLLDNLTFHDCVSPIGGGGTLTYGYYRTESVSSASFRAINSEYPETSASKKKCSVDLKVFGGSFKIDRVIANMGGVVDEVQFQMDHLIRATKALAHDTIIHGNSADNALAFDGLDVAVTGTSTEWNAGGTAIDLSTTEAIDANYKKFVDQMDEWLAELNNPSCLMMNAKMLAKVRAVARRIGMYQAKEGEFGKTIDTYAGIPLIDLGEKPGATIPSVNSSTTVVPIEDRLLNGEDTEKTTGLSDIYAVRFGMDAFHGVTLAGGNVIKTWLPTWEKDGAVKRGEVEMIMALALKETKSAGVFRNIKIK